MPTLTMKKMTSPKKIVRECLLVLLVMSFSGTLAPLHAQQEPAAPQKQEVRQAPKEPGLARQLAHETREAAGEEADETAAFKQSASVQLIAKWTGMSLQHAYWLSVLSNFVVIAVVIFWAARKYFARRVQRPHGGDPKSDAGGAKGQRGSAAEAGGD